jgi:hypothetical protein
MGNEQKRKKKARRNAIKVAKYQCYETDAHMPCQVMSFGGTAVCV